MGNTFTLEPKVVLNDSANCQLQYGVYSLEVRYSKKEALGHILLTH